MTATTSIGPEAYASWRATPLGKVTEAIEQRLIFDLIGNIDHARVLDAGCGDGALACAAALRGAAVIGVDPDPAMLAAARARAKQAGVEAAFSEGRIESLPFADASFDVVVAITVLSFVARRSCGAARVGARLASRRASRARRARPLEPLGPDSKGARLARRVHLGSGALSHRERAACACRAGGPSGNHNSRCRVLPTARSMRASSLAGRSGVGTPHHRRGRVPGNECHAVSGRAAVKSPSRCWLKALDSGTTKR